MSDDLALGRPLSVDAVERKHFGRNFITQAVCEFRFPTLLELEGDQPPSDLAYALRKEFPTYQRLTNVKMGSGSVGQSNVHAFHSRKNRWSVNIRAASLALETSHYDSFEDFRGRIAFVLKAAEKTIDSDFFTRIGLRYINGVPCDRGEVGEWINPRLVDPLASGVFGDPEEYSQRVVGTTAMGGGFMFSHGLGTNSKTGKFEYLLDFDFFVEDVAVSDAMSVLQQLHDSEHALFRWTLGRKAEAHLGI